MLFKWFSRRQSKAEVVKFHHRELESKYQKITCIRKDFTPEDFVRNVGSSASTIPDIHCIHYIDICYTIRIRIMYIIWCILRILYKDGDSCPITRSRLFYNAIPCYKTICVFKDDLYAFLSSSTYNVLNQLYCI